MFLAVDGIDGAGKTTLVQKLGRLFKKINPVLTKEPTVDSEWGHKLREAAAEGRLPRKKEIKLFHYDRLEHIRNVIRPAIENGRLVITDRYVDSTLAFQADTPEQAENLYKKFLPHIIVPDLTLILCCSVEEGLQRIRARDGGKLTHFETLETLEKAQVIYESRRGDKYVHLDATGTVQDLLLEALQVLRERFTNLQLLIDSAIGELTARNRHTDSHANIASAASHYK